MNILKMVHWGDKAYCWSNHKLPSCEGEVLNTYLQAVATKPHGSATIEGTNGVTLFRVPVTLLGVVRGQEGEMYLVIEEEKTLNHDQ